MRRPRHPKRGCCAIGKKKRTLKLKRKVNLGHLDVDRRIIFKYI
jgi:hypothetical protein